MANGRQPGQSQTYGNLANYNEIMQAGGMAGQVAPTMGPTDNLVYMGKDYERPAMASDRLPKRPFKPSGASTAMRPIEFAVNEFWNFDPDQKARWAQISQGITGYRSPPSMERQFALWRDMNTYAGMASSARGSLVSAFDIGAEAAESAAAQRQGGSGGGGRYTGPVTIRDKSETVDLSNPSQARAFLDSALGEYLGRAPSTKEYRMFTKALNAAQEAAPEIIESVSTTTPVSMAEQRRESETKRRGGIEPGQFATEYARSQEGVAETQAGTTLLNAFLEMF